MQAYFLSDVHLKSLEDTNDLKNKRNWDSMLRFLFFLESKSEITDLILLGDIFDLWVGDSLVFYQKYQAIVDAILSVKKNKKINVYYIEGNHDMHLKKFWQSHGVKVSVDPLYIQLGSKTVRIEHGDLMNPEDEKYLKYRSFIRHSSVQWLAKILPGDWINYLGTRASQESRKHSQIQRDEQKSDLIQKIRKYSQKVWQEKSFDYLVAGHMHIQDEYNFHSCVAINTGSWLESPKALLLTDNGYRWLTESDWQLS